jgi:hypothetical protein
VNADDIAEVAHDQDLLMDYQRPSFEIPVTSVSAVHCCDTGPQNSSSAASSASSGATGGFDTRSLQQVEEQQLASAQRASLHEWHASQQQPQQQNSSSSSSLFTGAEEWSADALPHAPSFGAQGGRKRELQDSSSASSASADHDWRNAHDYGWHGAQELPSMPYGSDGIHAFEDSSSVSSSMDVDTQIVESSDDPPAIHPAHHSSMRPLLLKKKRYVAPPSPNHQIIIEVEEDEEQQEEIVSSDDVVAFSIASNDVAKTKKRHRKGKK